MAEGTGQAEGKIGQLLISEGVVTQDQVDEALAKQKESGGKTFEILIQLGHLDKNALHEFLSKQEGIVGIDLSNYELDEQYKDLVPEELATSALVIPIDKMGRNLTVAMACPLDTDTIARVQEHSGLRVRAMLCRLDDVKEGVLKLYAPKEEKAADFSFVPMSTGGGGAASATAKLVTSALEKLDYVTPPAESLLRIGKLMADSKVGIRKLVDEVSSHPGTAAWVLNVGNSAAYGMSQQVVSVALAGVLMGKDGMSKALTALVEESSATQPNLDHTAIARRAIFCSAAAEHMAGSANTSRSIMGTAGLLHEIGRVGLDQVKGDKYKSVDVTKYGAELIEEEKKAVGVGYPEAGYVLLSSWNLPDSISKIVRRHVDPSEAADEIKPAAAVLGAASIMAQVAGSKEAPLTPEEAVKQAAAILQDAGLDAKVAPEAFKAAAAAFKARLS